MRHKKLGPQSRLRLTEARTERNGSQQDITDRVYTTHLNVSHYESDITKPDPYYRSRFCTLIAKREHELDLTSTPISNGAVSANSALALSEELFDPIIPFQPVIRLVG